MKYVVFYESPDDIRALAREHFPAHQAWYMSFRERGLLLMLGPFADPGTVSAMAVFTTREAAEEWAKGDPFVLNGVVSHWTIREWHEALVPQGKSLV
jgi:uncharacterized protein